MKSRLKFSATGNGNEVLKGNGFFISFRSKTSAAPGTDMLGEMASLLTGDTKLKDRTDETALVIGRIFRILEGDFRTEYEGIADLGLYACNAFFESQRDEYGSGWSTNDEDRSSK